MSTNQSKKGKEKPGFQQMNNNFMITGSSANPQN